jgi:hypothetical protein
VPIVVVVFTLLSVIRHALVVHAATISRVIVITLVITSVLMAMAAILLDLLASSRAAWLLGGLLFWLEETAKAGLGVALVEVWLQSRVLLD